MQSSDGFERAALPMHLRLLQQSTHAVLLAAEREAENRQREALAHNRRTIENQLARAASCARQQVHQDTNSTVAMLIASAVH